MIVEKKPPTVEAENAVIDPRVADAFKLIDKCAGALLVVGYLSTLAERCVCGSPRARGSHRDGDGVATKAEVLLALRKHESVRELLGLSAAKEGDNSREAFEAAFAKIDVDESATLSPAELNAYLKDALGAQPAAAPPGVPKLWEGPPPLEVALEASIKVWGTTVFHQFDTDKNGVLDSKELSRALKALPKTKPTRAPPGAKFMSVDEMVAAMDADGNGSVDLEEWLGNLSKCAGLAAALAESVNEAGVIEKFRSFEEQKAKREREIAELESKMMTASPEEMEKIGEEMAEYERQVASLAKKIEEANANAARLAAEATGE